MFKFKTTIIFLLAFSLSIFSTVPLCARSTGWKKLKIEEYTISGSKGEIELPYENYYDLDLIKITIKNQICPFSDAAQWALTFDDTPESAKRSRLTFEDFDAITSYIQETLFFEEFNKKNRFVVFNNVDYWSDARHIRHGRALAIRDSAGRYVLASIYEKKARRILKKDILGKILSRVKNGQTIYITRSHLKLKPGEQREITLDGCYKLSDIRKLRARGQKAAKKFLALLEQEREKLKKKEDEEKKMSQKK